VEEADVIVIVVAGEDAELENDSGEHK